ncbi:MAG: hypothetical protein MRZ45_09315 [Blautia sp.]|nr:hypothetical protein [Blautia sp.]
MSHRTMRNIIHDICDVFYMRIKDLDGSEEAWGEISRIAEEYRIKYDNSRFAKDLMLAVTGELERTWEGQNKNGGKNRA